MRESCRIIEAGIWVWPIFFWQALAMITVERCIYLVLIDADAFLQQCEVHSGGDGRRPSRSVRQNAPHESSRLF